jgi:hypothetical protein
MAGKTKKTTLSASSLHKEKSKKRRSGIHAKTKTSKSKQSKLYKKVNIGQG